MPLINCKVHLELNWTKNCVVYGANTYVGGDNDNNRATTFKITNAELYLTIVTLSTKDSVSLTKHMNEGFKRLVYWNEYKSKAESEEADNSLTRLFLRASFQGVKTLYVLVFNDTTGAHNVDGPNGVKRISHRKYFLPRVNITNCNMLIDGRSFYDQPINDQIKMYDEIKKIATKIRKN